MYLLSISLILNLCAQRGIQNMPINHWIVFQILNGYRMCYYWCSSWNIMIMCQPICWILHGKPAVRILSIKLFFILTHKNVYTSIGPFLHTQWIICVEVFVFLVMTIIHLPPLLEYEFIQHQSVSNTGQATAKIAQLYNFLTKSYDVQWVSDELWL